MAWVSAGTVGARARLALRASPSASTLMKFSDVAALFGAGNTVWILSLGPGHGQAVLMLEAVLCRSLLAGAPGARTARPAAGPHPTPPHPRHHVPRRLPPLRAICSVS